MSDIKVGDILYSSDDLSKYVVRYISDEKFILFKDGLYWNISKEIPLDFKLHQGRNWATTKRGAVKHKIKKLQNQIDMLTANYLN